jgi:hypothetical protein
VENKRRSCGKSIETIREDFDHSITSRMSRIVGFKDIKEKEEEKKQNQLFAGGLDQRG